LRDVLAYAMFHALVPDLTMNVSRSKILAIGAVEAGELPEQCEPRGAELLGHEYRGLPRDGGAELLGHEYQGTWWRTRAPPSRVAQGGALWPARGGEGGRGLARFEVAARIGS